MGGAKKNSTAVRALPTIRASVLGPLLRRLDQAGPRADVLLAQHGLLRAQVTDPYAQILLKRYVAIFEDAAHALNDPLIGARLGASCTPADLGPAGVLFSVSSTIREAFERLAAYVHSLQGATNIELIVEHSDTLILNYSLSDAKIWPRVQDAEFSLSASCHLVRRCFRTSWQPIEIHCEHDCGEREAELRQILQAPIRFRQSRNRIVMERREAERPFRDEDRDLVSIIERHTKNQAAQMTSNDTGSLRQQVLRVIGLHMGYNPVTTATVARELQLSTRSLQRRLAEEGSSLRQLLQEHRMQLAERYLAKGDMRLDAVAEVLGYADSTAFGRAYKSWTGRSPSSK
ncbi:AraC family transcriptional regulator [Aurantimonas sp. VKM B-3413]|uniref:AraC family transcriptional regulator n=1 Tax=Aurantimonas sp. VKM B-3413 TaxID=2779401 RepID=UPI001E4CA2E6|nr:AraC family transcriptional regulator [Aurantimonas sp. VKM B-3413]MCB8836287.1 AraC family transcriptional regulator [Aurantimonas sp. VKM B-3413]